MHAMSQPKMSCSKLSGIIVLLTAVVLSTTVPAAAAPDKTSVNQSTAKPVASTPQLTWRDLVGHPERWPKQTSMTVGITVDREPINQGTQVGVYDVTPSQVEIVAPAGYTLMLEQGDTTLLVDANAFWATLTPEQRQLTMQSIAADRSLWPTQVEIVESVSFGSIGLDAGMVRDVVEIQGNKVKLFDPRTSDLLNVDAKYTDLISRARALAVLPPKQRPGMMTQILKGVTLDSSGKKTDAKDARYYVFYVSASTCPRCHAFTPELVKYFKENFAKRDDVAFISWPTEPTTQPMLEYMKKTGIPWLTLPANPKEKGRAYSLINGQGRLETPGFLVVDKFGTPLLSTGRMAGQPMDTASAAVNQLSGLLKRVD